MIKTKYQQEFEDFFELIPSVYKFHNTDSSLYKVFNDAIIKYFDSVENEVIQAHPFNNLVWPNISLGNLDSYNYFSMGEMITYSFYWNNKSKYNTVFDIGGNIGVDSIILSKFGYEVYSFEPDPEMFKIMKENIELNKLDNIHLYCKGMSDKIDTMEFVRVKGNPTSSHIAGARDFYGEIDTFKIQTIRFEDVGVIPDLMKINIEGHEKVLVPAIAKYVWDKCDAFIELHGLDCAQVIFEHFNKIGINIFSQKVNWEKVTSVEQLPLSYKEGLIFVSSQDVMEWKL